MTEKFTLKHFDWLQRHIYKDGEFYIEVTDPDDGKRLCDLLNALYIDNERLKAEDNRLDIFVTNVLEENEKLKEQYHDLQYKVSSAIQHRIIALKRIPFGNPVGNPLSVNFDADMDRLARLSELQQLKKELKKELDYE